MKLVGPRSFRHRRKASSESSEDRIDSQATLRLFEYPVPAAGPGSFLFQCGHTSTSASRTSATPRESGKRMPLATS